MTTTALDPKTISTALQLATIRALGLPTPASPIDPVYKLVRIDWPTEGQPAWGIGEDIVFIGALLVDDPSDKVRDLVMGVDGSGNPLETITQQAVWRASWTVYGPNATLNARKIRAALFWQSTHDLLALSNLYLVPALPQVIRAPELFQGQWWERADFSAEYNEGVTDTYAVQTVRISEVIVDTADGITVADVTVTETGGT